jgi:hypothetical protein
VGLGEGGGGLADGEPWKGFVSRSLAFAGRYRGIPPE